jgi:hypothetical protein
MRSENQHLLGLAVRRGMRGERPLGEVVGVGISADYNYPTVFVDFPDSDDPIELIVVRHRRPRDWKEPDSLDYIWLKRGTDEVFAHRYGWVDLDAALHPPPPRTPTAIFAITVEAATSSRVAERKKPSLAAALAEALAGGVADTLDELPDGTPVDGDVDVQPKVSRRGKTDEFDLEIAIQIFDVDDDKGRALFARLVDLLEAAAPTPVGVAQDNWLGDYFGSADPRIVIQRFAVTGSVAGQQLAPVEGRLCLPPKQEHRPAASGRPPG